MELSKRDKAAIQTVTRYADVLRERKYVFSCAFGRVLFRKPGTTSEARFTEHAGKDRGVVEEYIAELAAFAYRRLARQYGSGALGMIDRFVTFYSPGTEHRLELGEMMEERLGLSRREVVERTFCLRTGV